MGGEIFIYVISGAVLLIFVRRYFITRSIQDYAPREVEEMLLSGRSIMLLDVRTEKEWSQSHLKGAHHIPLGELGRRMHELEKHKNREIICYCQSGNRSLTAAMRLKRLGFSVSHMKGGMAEWNFQHLK